MTLFTQKQLQSIVEEKIAHDENLGTSSGSSGHLGHISSSIKEIKDALTSEGFVEISYHYCLTLETEFTYYPDNPPQEIEYSKKIIVDKKKQIISESEKLCLGSSSGDDFLISGKLIKN